jgi:hypothetical protein
VKRPRPWLATGADVEGAGEEAAGKDIVSMSGALGRTNQLDRSGLGVCGA